MPVRRVKRVRKNYLLPVLKNSYFCAPVVLHGDVAQLVEQRTENPCVSGSIPLITTTFHPTADEKSGKAVQIQPRFAGR
jgi:hypothetical protein